MLRLLCIHLESVQLFYENMHFYWFYTKFTTLANILRLQPKGWLLRSGSFQYNVYKCHDIFQMLKCIHVHVLYHIKTSYFSLLWLSTSQS